MNNFPTLTCVMYHYVRDLKHSRFPEIKGIDISLFIEQLNFLKKYYNIISMEEAIDSIENGTKIPQNSMLLTFDDGYTDHFNYVFPILDEMKLKGSFFIPAKAVIKNKMLDVNKIHYILASEEDKNKLIKDIFKQLDYYRNDYNLKSNEYYFDKLASANRYDPKEVIFIKRLLQVELDENLRKKIADYLFEKYIGMDETSFSRELYMNSNQIKCMNRHGMHIGCHSYDHYWLNSLSYSEQEKQIDLSLQFLKNLNIDTTNWTMCYPYSGHNKDTMKILKNKNCKLAFTSNVNFADFNTCNKYEVPRFDTNDFPKDRNALNNIEQLKKVCNYKY
jgi:peptidoglycan/xylan/chitin deacetylase (PgdA/CDA1 family)